MLCLRRLLQFSVLTALLCGCASPPSESGKAATADTSSNTGTGPGAASGTSSGGKTGESSSGRFDPASRPQTESARRATMQRFGVELAAQRKLPEPKVLQLLEEARYNPTVARIVAPVAAGQPRAPRSWVTYRGRVVEQAGSRQREAGQDRAQGDERTLVPDGLG